jgi:hypothetical protein
MWRYFRQGRAVWKRSGIRLVQARWRANAAWFWGCGWRLGRPSDAVIAGLPGPASGLQGLRTGLSPQVLGRSLVQAACGAVVWVWGMTCSGGWKIVALTPEIFSEGLGHGQMATPWRTCLDTGSIAAEGPGIRDFRGFYCPGRERMANAAPESGRLCR